MRRTLLLAAFCMSQSACSIKDVEKSDTGEIRKMSAEYYGLRAARYNAADISAARRWYSDVLGSIPYVDRQDYVAFNAGGFELGITADTVPPAQRASVFWGVADAARSYARLISMGASDFEPVHPAGNGVKIGAVRDPFGNILGIIENPEFRYAPPLVEGPGR